MEVQNGYILQPNLTKKTKNGEGLIIINSLQEVIQKKDPLQ